MVHGFRLTQFLADYGYGAGEKPDEWIPPPQPSEDVDGTQGTTEEERLHDMLKHCEENGRQFEAQCSCAGMGEDIVPETRVRCGTVTPWVKCSEFSVDRNSEQGNMHCVIPAPPLRKQGHAAPPTLPDDSKEGANSKKSKKPGEGGDTEDAKSEGDDGEKKEPPGSLIVDLPLDRYNDQCYPSNCPLPQDVHDALSQCKSEDFRMICLCGKNGEQNLSVSCMKPRAPKIGVLHCDTSRISRGYVGDSKDPGYITCKIGSRTYTLPYTPDFHRNNVQIIDRCGPCAPKYQKSIDDKNLPLAEKEDGSVGTATAQEMKDLELCLKSDIKLGCKCGPQNTLVVTAQCTNKKQHTDAVQCLKDGETFVNRDKDTGRLQVSCDLVTKQDCYDWTNDKNCDDGHRVIVHVQGAGYENPMISDRCGPCTDEKPPTGPPALLDPPIEEEGQPEAAAAPTTGQPQNEA